MAISIIDTDRQLTAAKLDQFWNAGIRSIGRYLNRRAPTHEKVVKPAEARLFAARGMRLFLIYEYDGKPNGSAIGSLDGEWANNYAPSVGAPTDGSAFIAYTVDYDATERAMPGIRDAFTAFGKAVEPAFQVWAYASGAVCSELSAAKLITGRWLTMSGGFRGTRQAIAAGAFEMRQALDQKIAGLDIDPNNMHEAGDLPGFIPFAAVAQSTEGPPRLSPAGYPEPPNKPSEGIVQRAEDEVKKIL